MAGTILRTGLLYPAIIPVQNDTFAHPIYVDMAEVSLNPIPGPSGTDHQGSVFHFPCAGDKPGHSVNNISRLHYSRAWKTVGFQRIHFTGSVRIPNDLIRADYASSDARTAPIEFDFTLDGDLDDIHMAHAAQGETDGIVVSDATDVTHAGTPYGELFPNGGFLEQHLGEWQFYGLNATSESVVGSQVIGTVNHYDEFGFGPTPRNVTFTLTAMIRGNTSLLRYIPDDPGDFQYFSIFWIQLFANLSVQDDDGGWFEGMDGSNSFGDGAPNLNQTPGYCSTDLAAVAGTSINTSCGECDLTANSEPLTPNAKLFQKEPVGGETFNYTAPWPSGDLVFQLPIWSDVSITFERAKTATFPQAP